MKLILVFSLISFNIFAQECTKNEAQFFGVVTNKKIESAANKCSFNIQIRNLQNSILCPIDSFEISETRFTIDTCSIENGQIISGYLTQDLETREIVID